MHGALRIVLASLGALIAASAAAGAELATSPLFGDGMVLQRDEPIPIWGRAEPGETVKVRLAGQTKSCMADEDGNWRVGLDPMAAGGPHTLEIDCEPDRLRFADVLVGEVWLCGGQSNMQWPVWRSNNAEEEIAAARYPRIRVPSSSLYYSHQNS